MSNHSTLWQVLSNPSMSCQVVHETDVNKIRRIMESQPERQANIGRFLLSYLMYEFTQTVWLSLATIVDVYRKITHDMIVINIHLRIFVLFKDLFHKENCNTWKVVISCYKSSQVVASRQKDGVTCRGTLNYPQSALLLFYLLILYSKRQHCKKWLTSYLIEKRGK